MFALPRRRLGALALGLLAARVSAAPARRLRVLATGAHPDDPEAGCGGTLARYAAAGHAVAVYYLTRGEAGIPGKSAETTAAIRSAEAREACRRLGARPLFGNQVDAATEYTSAHVARLEAMLRAERPDVVLTHWPVDTHMDHQVTGVSTMQALHASRQPARLFFYEVMTGVQTMAFTPNAYVDISAVRERKKQALFAHRSQPVATVYREHHAPMEELRGREAGVAAAEAFLELVVGHPAARGLPGL